MYLKALCIWNNDYTIISFNPLASEARREVANLIERKNPITPAYGVNEFVHLSVTDPNYLGTGQTEWAEFFLGHLWQKTLWSNQNQKPFEKKFALLAAGAVFVSSFFLQKQ